MSSWSDRLVAERAELADRLTRLAAFISRNEADGFGALDLVDKDLLRRQRAAMLEYHDILDERVSRLVDV